MGELAKRNVVSIGPHQASLMVLSSHKVRKSVEEIKMNKKEQPTKEQI